MIRHVDITDKVLHQKIKQGSVLFGGNVRLNIVGALHCGSGKIMKRENRVFFESYYEAITKGYRPCGNCMTVEYQQWTCSDKR